MGGGSFSGIWWSSVFGVCCLWRHNLTSYSCFQTNVLAKCVNTICIFVCARSLYFMCNCTEYNYQRSKLRYRRKINSTLRHSNSITAKLSGCTLKQGRKIHSSLRQSNLQRKYQAALMSYRIRAVEHEKCASGLAGGLSHTTVCKTVSC